MATRHLNRAAAAVGVLLLAAACARAPNRYVPVPNTSPYDVAVDTTRIERRDGELWLWLRLDWRNTPGMGRVGPYRATGQEVRVRVDCVERRYQQLESRLVTQGRRPPTVDRVIRWDGTEARFEDRPHRGEPEWHYPPNAPFDIDAVCTRWGARGAQERAAGATNAVPEFAFVIDPAATAAGLAPLRANALPPGAREVRIWTGFGLGIPHDLYRLHAARGAVITGCAPGASSTARS